MFFFNLFFNTATRVTGHIRLELKAFFVIAHIPFYDEMHLKTKQLGRSPQLLQASVLIRKLGLQSCMSTYHKLSHPDCVPTLHNRHKSFVKTWIYFQSDKQ